MTHLPGDPSGAEIWLLFLGFIVVPVVLVILLVLILFKKQLHIPYVVGIIILLASPALYRITARNFGEWAELKTLIQNYELKVNKFVNDNGPITTFEEK
jgi:hypothetical protein